VADLGAGLLIVRGRLNLVLEFAKQDRKVLGHLVRRSGIEHPQLFTDVPLNLIA
jgi:hypothetical protein